MPKKKYCPGLVGMLYIVLELDEKSISVDTGIEISSVYSILNRRFNRPAIARKKRVNKEDIDLDALEVEYLAGVSTYELGKKYNASHQTISRWMNQRGHIRGKDIGSKGINKGHETERQRGIARCKAITLEMTGGTIEFVDLYERGRGLYRCRVCGAEFLRCNKFERRPQCPECAARELEAIRKRNNGKTFETGGSYRTRCKKYGVEYDPSVTRKKLIERDNNICQICGEPCDSTDKRWGHFGPLTPTVDHIVAITNGGGHTWDNVQLAHAICNFIKHDLTEEELTEEVITHAKEQAIAHKCA